MSIRHTLRVPTATGGYDIVIGTDLLADPAVWSALRRDAVALVVTNPVVGAAYREAVTHALAPHVRTVDHVELPDGETAKAWSSVLAIVDRLVALKADRRAVLVALGGGVVGDITGFAASVYMRGIDHVQVPTTLLSQVDSSVGGKTAINHPGGKNLIGTFHPPFRVVSDMATLATLPPREFKAGLAEVIKYGAIADAGFFDWLEGAMSALLARDEAALAQAIRRSCELKAAVVAADEKESGLRAILNFGHTFAHAIETGAGYGNWLHGEAVGCGMAMAAQASREAGLATDADGERLTALLRRAGLPIVAPMLGAARWIDLMQSDKKAEAGEIRLVLMQGLGRAVLQAVPPAAVASVVRSFEGPSGASPHLQS